MKTIHIPYISIFHNVKHNKVMLDKQPKTVILAAN